LVGNQPLAHVTLTLVTAYGAFIAAEHFLHASGIMAVLAAGLMVGYRTPLLYSRKVREYLEMFWEDAAFVANSLIFLMLGLSEKIFLTHIHYNIAVLLYPVLIAIAIVLVARFVVVYTFVPLVNVIPGINSIDHRYRLILSWGGLRGAIAIALAMSLPIHFPYRWQIIDLAFGVTLFMLLFNGATVGWLMRRLGVDEPSVSDQYLSSLVAAEAQREALARVERRTPMATVDEGVLTAIRGAYSVKLENINAHAQALRTRLAESWEERCRLLWFQTLAVQRKIYHARHDEGLLCLKFLNALEWAPHQTDTDFERHRLFRVEIRPKHRATLRDPPKQPRQRGAANGKQRSKGRREHARFAEPATQTLDCQRPRRRSLPDSRVHLSAILQRSDVS
jgi:CPA1 family monovalent cation:H+ antiporter